MPNVLKEEGALIYGLTLLTFQGTVSTIDFCLKLNGSFLFGDSVLDHWLSRQGNEFDLVSSALKLYHYLIQCILKYANGKMRLN